MLIQLEREDVLLLLHAARALDEPQVPGHVKAMLISQLEYAIELNDLRLKRNQEAAIAAAANRASPNL
jgi:hypothetical protein